MTILDDESIESQKRNEETTKKDLITPVIEERWPDKSKVLMEYKFTDGRISVDEYNMSHRGKSKKADYLLLHQNNLILAVVEAKAQDRPADDGYNQAKIYAEMLDAPFAYATNGTDLIELDRISGIRKDMKMIDFPTGDTLWSRYVQERNLNQDELDLITYPYYTTQTGKKPRYYQRIAINRIVEAVARGQNRIMLVMATGTGKTFTAFQIVYRLFKSRKAKKILFLADRNILVDQTMTKDFKPFADAMVKIDNRRLDTSKDIYLGLYQQLKSSDKDYYKQLPRDFFDLIVIDECHRGSANSDSNWHDILEYFSPATQVGMTATPKDGGIEEAQNQLAEAKELLNDAKETRDQDQIRKAEKRLEKAYKRLNKAYEHDNTVYFGEPVYTYSLKQGIEDGFLAPYKVTSVELNIDRDGYTPKPGDEDTEGNPLESITYHQSDFDRTLIVQERRELVAKRISDYMKANDNRYAKSIVFCENIEHCQEMVKLLEKENADLVAKDSRYIMQITGDNEIGKVQLDNFVEPSSKYPVIAVTSRLMSTGVDAETCENVILDRMIGSMTEFKQIVGRGTRIKEKYEVDGEEKSKTWFNVLDFRKNYLKFNDPEFDGEPVTVTEVPEDNDFPKPPIKPEPPKDGDEEEKKKRPSKQIRVAGVDVEIVGEDIQYMDSQGNLIQQNLTSCVRNNIISRYITEEDFRKAWLLTNDKEAMARDLLLDDEWPKRFKIRYGYEVDDFDIILAIGFDVDPPMSKNQRIQSGALAVYLSEMDAYKARIVKIMLQAYSKGRFSDLKSVKETFSNPAFEKIGVTPKTVQEMFGSRKNYFDFLQTLENKLYE